MTSPGTQQPSIRALSAQDVASLVNMDDAITTQRRAFVALARGEAVLAPRLLVPGREDSFGFVYSSRSSRGSDLVVKAGSLVPANAARGLGTVSAFVLVLDAETGAPKAVVDGAAVTDLRTVAASAAAAQALCPAPRTIAVVGLGPQGRAHARVLSRVLRPSRLKVWARSATAGSVQALGVDDATLSASAAEAVAGADLVVLCTTSAEPVVELGWLEPTATVLSLGSVSPSRREVGPDVVGSARLVVDDVDAAVAQAGPIVAALEAGTIAREHLEAIGGVMLAQDAEGWRPGPARLTYYNSVGVGIQDAAVVGLILDRAEEAGVGRTWVL